MSTIPIENTVDVKYTSVGPFISDAVSLLLSLAAIATFGLLAYGGFLWLVSGGDKTKIEAARDRITGAIIGLGIVAATWAVFRLVDSFLGLGIAQ